MLLSICIPTFERCEHLDKLLLNISSIEKKLLKNIQVCISNNCSKDKTEHVINNYKKKINIKSKIQKTNIGAYSNLIDVLNMAEGDWSLPIGDDDNLGSEFYELIYILENISKNTLIFNGVRGFEVNEYIFINFFKNGPISKNHIKRKVIKEGLYPFGYIGNYTFPTSLLKKNKNIPKNWFHIWIFLALLNMKDTKFYSLNKNIISFKNSGNLFWSLKDRCIINIDKLTMLIQLQGEIYKKNFKLFLFITYIRELFDLGNLKNFIACRVISKNKEIKDLIQLYNDLKKFIFLNKFYIICLSIIMKIPIKYLIKIINRKNPQYIEKYLTELKESKQKSNDGSKRII